jgi:DNA-binding NtrC family response regulator
LIQPQHFALPSRSKAPGDQATTNLGTLERETIERVLRETRWNKSRAAQYLGLSRTQLYIRIRKYGLERPRLHGAPISISRG